MSPFQLAWDIAKGKPGSTKGLLEQIESLGATREHIAETIYHLSGLALWMRNRRLPTPEETRSFADEVTKLLELTPVRLWAQNRLENPKADLFDILTRYNP